jgi:hypothetical protein
LSDLDKKGILSPPKILFPIKGEQIKRRDVNGRTVYYEFILKNTKPQWVCT